MSSGKCNWHHRQPATAVLKTRQLNKCCRDARFCRQQEQTCGQRQSSYTPNSTAARRSWKRRPHSSCWLDSQCDRGEERRRRGHSVLQLTTLTHKRYRRILYFRSPPPPLSVRFFFPFSRVCSFSVCTDQCLQINRNTYR